MCFLVMVKNVFLKLLLDFFGCQINIELGSVVFYLTMTKLHGQQKNRIQE